MKKHIIVSIIYLFFGIDSANSQNKELEDYTVKMFQYLQNKDIDGFLTGFFEEKTFQEIFQKNLAIHSTKKNAAAYSVASYTAFKSNFLSTLPDNFDSNLNDFTIKKIKCFEYKKEDMDNINFHSTILLLKKKNDDRDWTIIFSDIISYNNKYYYGHFSRLNVMPYSSFEEMISTIEIREGLITYENESAAAPRYVEETEEISPPPPSIYDEDESDVKMQITFKEDFEAKINDTYFIFHLNKEVDLDEDKYNECYYSIKNTNKTESFAQVVSLGNDIRLFVDYVGNYFRLKRIDGKLVGIWFSNSEDKQYDVTFLAME